MFLFINHDKKLIKIAGNDAKTNISKNICKTIRENKWTICDHIEFVEYLTVERSFIKDLIDTGYDCEHQEWFNFY